MPGWGPVLPVLLLGAALARANLEGPFLFFGPPALERYRRPALRFLGQDELTRLYAAPACVVVFGSAGGGAGGVGARLPRLREALRRAPVLPLPQDFLDVRPDCVSNETQVLTLQGPWSERDAQMTETFARLQDIYGVGRVLGILGNSVPQRPPSEEAEEWARVRRGADDAGASSSPSPSPAPPAEDDRASRPQQTYALFNASGQPGKGALVGSSGWPELVLSDGARLALDAPVGEPTVRTTRLYTILVVRFADADNTREKIKLELNFKAAGGWWAAVGAEVSLRGASLSLLAPAPPAAPAAVLGRAYRCARPLVYQGNGTSLTFPDIQMQPFMDSTEEFADSFDCVGFTTAPIWSGLMVSALMLLALGGAVCLILDIRTMDRFESSRAKQLTVTVSE